ncbi:MAG: cation:dicarboxylase symporter family transporter, partial [Selenomonadaceae bacterium]|nr:cation:dicarboxylase symporter family transporter [Selenomonadaceae bacterium]
MSNNKEVEQTAADALKNSSPAFQKKQIILWIGALVAGMVLGLAGNSALNELFNFIATVFTRLFQFVAIPTIALAIITTLSTLGAQKNVGRIFAHTVFYTLLTTISAAAVGLTLYLWISPATLPIDLIGQGAENVPGKLSDLSYYDHFLSVIPNNILAPIISGNVLSVLIIAAALGLGLAFMPKTKNRETLLSGIFGAQELLFTLIRALIWALPVGILAFAAQLSAEIEAGVIIGALGQYVA